MLGHTDLRKDVLIELDGVPFRVVEYSHKAMGRGGAVVQAKLKNLLTGGVLEKSFRTADKIAPANIERENMQFLYRDGGGLAFMNEVTYDQETVPVDVIGDQAKFLAEGSSVPLLRFNGKIIGAEMPNNVLLKVTETEPGIKGDTAASSLKASTVETGVNVQVPLFINIGDIIKVDTRTGQYLERQK